MMHSDKLKNEIKACQKWWLTTEHNVVKEKRKEKSHKLCHTLS